MTVILHISDPHFGDKHHRGFSVKSDGAWTMGKSIRRAVRQSIPEDTKIDAIVISGDLFENPEIDEEKALDGVHSVYRELETDPERVYCVPGNHDVNWEGHPELDSQRYRTYNSVIDKLRLKGKSQELPSVEKLVPAIGADRGVALLLLNSSLIVSREKENLGFVSENKLELLTAKLQQAGVSAENYDLIAVLHHHLLPVLNVKPADGEGFSVVIDAPNVLRQLAKIGVKAVLHGHQHRWTILRYEDVQGGVEPTYLLAGGSCGTADTWATRQFFLYEIERSVMRVKVFEQDGANSDHFALVRSEIAIPLGESRNGKHTCTLHDRARLTIQPSLLNPQLADSSNLFFLFFNVRDCKRSREVLRAELIRLFASSVGKDAMKKKAFIPNEPRVKLEGMYDVLGRWDIVVKLRLSIKPELQQEYGNLIVDHFYERLQKNEQFQERRDIGSSVEVEVEEPKPLRKASFRSWQNVLHETSAQDFLNLGSSLSPRISSQKFQDISDYERFRCQRAFLQIAWPDECRSDPVKRAEFFTDLQLRLADPMMVKTMSKVAHPPRSIDWERSILQAVYTCDDCIIMEFLMMCADSMELNRLTRALEGPIAEWDTYRSSLICCDYDELEYEIV